jgi:mRNA-degrading endonuclease toxin of MazEF toxin-antitoxin module
MKTAISIPDDVFRSAEKRAKRLKKSRSRLYSEAVAEYVARRSPADVTEAYDRRAEAPGNVLCRSRATGLPKDSVANVSQIFTVDRELLAERVGRLSRRSPRGGTRCVSPDA